MPSLAHTIVLAAVSVLLVALVLLALVITPYAAIGLAPVLFALAAIIRAINGSHTDSDKKV